MWCSVIVYGDFTHFVSKSNFKLSSARTNILKVAFLAVNLVKNIREIARISLSNNMLYVLPA